MITITITNGKDSLIGKTDEGKVAFLRGQHNAHVGEAFFAEVIREEERFLVVSLGEKIEPPVFDSKEKEDVVSSCGDYVVIRCETRRNIRNTFGGGMGGFAEGVNLSAYPYLYGDKDCREPLNYRRHGDRHEFYAVRSTGRAAERRRVQEARAAAETAAIAASEKAARIWIMNQIKEF